MISIKESSPDTPRGSRTRDLVQSKQWLCRSLESLDLTIFDHIYVLGSWYGIFAKILLSSNIEFKHLYMIDWDSEKSKYVKSWAEENKLDDRVHAVCMDVNLIRYVGSRICIINTSTNDIEDREWFTSIPSGSVVVLQGRNNQDISNSIETLDRFNKVYKLGQTLLLDSLVLEGVDDEIYTRFMKIGIK